MNEKKYYEPIRKEFEELFKDKGEISLEITANKKFSNNLKAQISNHREIIFYFLKEAAPDISGFRKRDLRIYSIVIEIKDEVIKLDHIYQTRKYAELFDAKFAFLVSTQEIPEEIKKLSKAVRSLLSLPYSYPPKRLVMVQFNKDTNKFVDWFEENPFKDEYLWK